MPLRHVLVVEEAHRLLKNTEDGPAAAAVELFASLLAEIRAYGEGVVIVEQIPSKILPDVVKNSALKIMHRLPAEDDRRAVGATMNLQQDQSENVVALPPGRAAVAADGMDRPVLTEIPHGEHDESTKQASAEPPLLGSRSPLCGAACHREPCTLRTMNDSHHRSLEPLHLIWVEAAASAQAMGMAAPAPAAAVREALRALAPRDLECTLVYAVERAVSAREALMRDEVDPADFAERLYAVLSDLLLGVEPRPADRRRYTYANYRFRDVLEAVHHARRARPDGPHAYPDEAPDWAARGLVLTGTTPTDHFTQITSLAGYGSEKAHGRIGDVVRSGLRAAVLTATGGLTEAHVRRAFRPACTGPGCCRYSTRSQNASHGSAWRKGEPDGARRIVRRARRGPGPATGADGHGGGEGSARRPGRRGWHLGRRHAGIRGKLRGRLDEGRRLGRGRRLVPVVRRPVGARTRRGARADVGAHACGRPRHRRGRPRRPSAGAGRPSVRRSRGGGRAPVDHGSAGRCGRRR